MLLFYLLLCIGILILLISWLKFHPFIAFLIVSLLAGWLLNIPLRNITASVKNGIGSLMGELAIIITLGAMLGKLVAESGAAQRISNVLIKTFGVKYFQWAMMVTGFVVGIPLFYNVGFVLLVPLIFSVVYQTKLPAVFVGLPMLAALSVTHGFLPPHPSPTALVAQFDADLGLTLLYGIVISIPVIVIAGPLFGQTVKNLKSEPLKTFQPRALPDEELPGTANSFLSSLLPVLLLIITTTLPFIAPGTKDILLFWGDPVIVMLISLMIATFSLGVANRISLKSIMSHYGDAAKDVVLILLIVAGAGALKQVLVDSGVSKSIGDSLKGLSINPLVLGWLIACVLRVCVGSATVAGLTAAGIVLPLVQQPGVTPELMVLSVGAGSLMFSHVNDSGFWLFKEYFNLSIKQTIRSWSLMETLVAILGLIGVLILDIFI